MISRFDLANYLSSKLLSHPNFQVYIDDGTLLGFYRDGHVLDHEFDVDMSISMKSYEKVVALRSHFLEKYHFTLYTQYDYIFQKAWTLLYMLKWDPYLSGAPCVRIYDEDKWYYADIYCDQLVFKDAMLNMTTDPPRGYDDPANADKAYLCNLEPGPSCHFEDAVRVFFLPSHLAVATFIDH